MARRKKDDAPEALEKIDHPTVASEAQNDATILQPLNQDSVEQAVSESPAEQPEKAVLPAAVSEDVVIETPVEPWRVNFAKDFIVMYAKEYRRRPKCPSQVLLDVIDDLYVECDVDKAQQCMSDKDIVAAAERLFDISEELRKDFSLHHDQANESIKSIMRTHVPVLQKSFDQYEAKLIEADAESHEE